MWGIARCKEHFYWVVLKGQRTLSMRRIEGSKSTYCVRYLRDKEHFLCKESQVQKTLLLNSIERTKNSEYETYWRIKEHLLCEGSQCGHFYWVVLKGQGTLRFLSDGFISGNDVFNTWVRMHRNSSRILACLCASESMLKEDSAFYILCFHNALFS